MSARDLVSKLLAAGLSAGLFLIWWPEHHPTTGIGSLIVRGALWTLTFELLVLAFTPLERVVTRAVRKRITVRRRLDVPPPARIGGACVLACIGAALPIALLSGAHAPRPAHAKPQQPRRVVVVKRQKVVVKREVVTVPVTAAAAHPEPVVRVVRAEATTKKAKATKTAKAKAAAPKPAPTKPTTTTANPPAEPTPTTTQDAPAPDVSPAP